MTSIANMLFDGEYAQGELEEKIRDAGIPHSRIGWDYYDVSLELYDVPSEYRLSPKHQKMFFDCGFIKVYINHVDFWETHYSLFDSSGKEFKSSDGWRVSYPHKRPEGGVILVEKEIPSWPKELFEKGRVTIVKPDNS